MATKDPISDALLNLYEVHAQRRQAELNLDQARAKEAITGRTAVPGVFAQLRAQADKEAARAAKIAKATEAGQPSPASQLPQQMQITGQTTHKDASGALSALGDIAKKVSGGSWAKTAGTPGGVAGRSIPQAGQAAGIPGPGAGGGAAPAQPVNVPSPAGQTGGPLVPGSTIPVTTPLAGWQRALRGVGALGQVANRDFGGAVSGIEQAVTGKEIIGEQQVPTVPEIAAPFAKSLAVYQARRTSSNPLIAKSAEQQYQASLTQIEQELIPRYGPDYAKEIVHTAELQASRERLLQEETERLKSEDPEVKARRDIGRTKSKLIEEGPDALSEGEKEILNLERKGIGDVTVKILQPPTTAQLEQRSIRHFDSIDRLGSVQRAIANYPGFFQRGAEKEVQYYEELSKNGFPLSDEQKTTIQRYRNADRAFAQLTKDSVRVDAGATMTPGEVQLIMDTLPSKSDSYEGAMQKLGDIQHMFGLDTFRDLTMRKVGLPDDPAFAKGFAESELLASQAAEARMQDLQTGGSTPEDAYAQVEREFRSNYGIELDRLLAAPPEPNSPMRR